MPSQFTPNKILVELAYKKFGIVADDSEIIAFVASVRSLDALLTLRRYSEHYGEGGGVALDSDGDYVRLSDVITHFNPTKE